MLELFLILGGGCLGWFMTFLLVSQFPELPAPAKYAFCIIGTIAGALLGFGLLWINKQTQSTATQLDRQAARPRPPQIV